MLYPTDSVGPPDSDIFEMYSVTLKDRECETGENSIQSIPETTNLARRKRVIYKVCPSASHICAPSKEFEANR